MKPPIAFSREASLRAMQSKRLWVCFRVSVRVVVGRRMCGRTWNSTIKQTSPSVEYTGATTQCHNRIHIIACAMVIVFNCVLRGDHASRGGHIGDFSVTKKRELLCSIRSSSMEEHGNKVLFNFNAALHMTYLIINLQVRTSCRVLNLKGHFSELKAHKRAFPPQSERTQTVSIFLYAWPSQRMH